MLAGFAFVGCNDLETEINGLAGRVEALEKSVADLQAAIDGGAVITNVETTADGVKVTLSDGSTFTVKNGADGAKGDKGETGAAGAPGANGANATVWTIGEDGYWYQDGVKTNYKAVGTDGANGANGENGADGENGFYYVPNEETGCFDVYQIGEDGEAEFVEETTISWKAAGVSAVLDGDTLTLTNVEGAEGPVVITLGAELNSVAFIPSVVDEGFTTYPTTDAPFYHVANYVSEAFYCDPASALHASCPQDDWYKFLPQNMDASNSVVMEYRLNPAAVAQVTYWGFINRSIKMTRSANDLTGLLIEDLYAGDNFQSVKDGIYTVDVRYNVSKATADNDVVALMLGQGTDLVTTADYVYVKSKPVNAVIANTNKTVIGQSAVQFYNRLEAIVPDKNEETDRFIKQYVGSAAHFEMVHDAELDLKPLAELYSNTHVTPNYLKNLDFQGMRYEYSLPEEYLADDTQKTNQQWFVTLNNGVLSANRANLTTGTTPAIGRTPVVRVDAYMCDNKGNEFMVASAYIKVQIKKEADYVADNLKGKIDEDKSFAYHADLEAEYTTVGQMDWKRFNTEVYGATGTNSVSFWRDYYGGASDSYNVKVTTTDKLGATVELVNATGVANGSLQKFATVDEAIAVEILLNKDDVTTSNVKVAVNNKAKTDLTYKNVDGKGAEYVVTLTIQSDNVNIADKGHVVLTQTFYVKQDCAMLPFNPLAYYETYTDLDNGTVYKDAVKITGKASTSNTWKMIGDVNDHFKRVNDKSIFDQIDAGLISNVESVAFEVVLNPLTPDYPEVVLAGTKNDMTVALAHEINEKDEVYTMKYTKTHVNAETESFEYNMVFVNPFVGAETTGTSIYLNSKVEVYAEVAPFVKVTESVKPYGVIYVWSDMDTPLDETDDKLVLTELATDEVYFIQNDPTVTYAFDTTNADYITLTSNMGEASVLDINPNTGKVTWKRVGNEYNRDLVIPVIATVKFEDLSIVECVIPVKFTKEVE